LKGRPLVLASASPQRRKILKSLGRRFEIVPSRVSERSSEKNPRKLVALLARRKALSVAKLRPDALVLGSDTLVVCAGRIIGKPKDRADALRILALLNGRWQRVYTGVAFAADGGKRVVSAVEVSRVLCRKLDNARLREFAGRHLDKAGAYAVQDKADPFVERVDGELDNVIGLPMKTVRRLYRRARAY
jgi:septum formation protein